MSEHLTKDEWAEAVRMSIGYGLGKTTALALRPGDNFVGAVPAATIAFPGADQALERRAFQAAFLFHLPEPLLVDNETGAIVQIGDKAK